MALVEPDIDKIDRNIIARTNSVMLKVSMFILFRKLG